MYWIRQRTLPLCVLLLLAACGGSGSSVDTDSTPEPIPPQVGGSYAGTDLSAPYPVRTTTGIVYATGQVNQAAPTEASLLLDLYEPDVDLAGAAVPTVVIIHGGGFIGGSRQGEPLQQFGADLAARGFVAASIDYRLVPDDPVLNSNSQALLDALGVDPTQLDVVRALFAALEDTEKAIQWLDSALGDLGATSQGVGLLGSSAGAVTALDYAYSLDGFNFPTLDVDAVAALWGTLVLGQDDPDVIQTSDAPVFMIHGTEDSTVDYQTGSLLVANRASAAGLPHELITIVGAGHGFGAIDVFSSETFPGSGQTQAERTYQFLAVALLAADCLQQELLIDNCSLP